MLTHRHPFEEQAETNVQLMWNQMQKATLSTERAKLIWVVWRRAVLTLKCVLATKHHVQQKQCAPSVRRLIKTVRIYQHWVQYIFRAQGRTHSNTLYVTTVFIEMTAEQNAGLMDTPTSSECVSCLLLPTSCRAMCLFCMSLVRNPGQKWSEGILDMLTLLDKKSNSQTAISFKFHRSIYWVLSQQDKL